MDDKKYDPPRIARNGRITPPKSPLSQSWIPSHGRKQSTHGVVAPSWMAQSEGLAMGMYCGAAVSLALATKYAVSGTYWNLNFCLLSVQSGMAVMIMLVLRYLGLIETGVWFDRRKMLMCAPTSLLLVLKGYLSLKALQCLSLPTYTILSNLETIALAQTESVSASSGFITMSFAIMIVAGAGAVWSDYDMAVASYGDRRLVQTLEPVDPVLNLIIGSVFIFASIFLSTVHSVLTRRIHKKETSFKDWDVTWYTNLLILPISGTLSRLIEDFSAENLYDNFRPSYLIPTILAILYTGLLTGLLPYAAFHCAKISGAKKTAYTKEAVNKFLVAGLGLMLFGTETKGGVNSDGVVAVGVAGVGSWMWIWAKEKWRREGGGKAESILPSSRSVLRNGGSSKDYLQ